MPRYAPNGDPWFNVLDFPGTPDHNGNGYLDPEDLIVECSDGVDDDGNGYVDDVSGWDVFAVSRGLREHGWQVPAYTFPDDRTDLAVLRVVCRNGFSHDLAELFFHDLRAVTQRLVTDPDAVGRTGTTSFHH